MERNVRALKILDKLFGVPLVLAIALLKKRRDKPTEIKSFGIFAFAAIGDSILSSVLISSIRYFYPKASITIFASKANAPIYSVLAGFDNLVVLSITKPWQAIPALRKHMVDVLIDTSQWSRLGAVYAALARARWTIGFRTANQNRAAAYDAVVEHSNQCHELDNFKRLLNPLGVSSLGELALSQNLKNAESVVSAFRKEKYIVLHPWASGSNYLQREWPNSSWVSLAKELIGRNFKIVISGSASDAMRANELAHRIDSEGEIRVVAGKASLAELSTMLLHAQGCVSVNTGIAHLSAGLGVPTIALNGPTNSVRWGICGERVVNVNVEPAAGGAFLNLGFEYPKNSMYLMHQIPVQSVLNALESLKVLK